VLPALDPATGLLPRGRHVCSEAEVEAAFVTADAFAASVTRPGIWKDWRDALSLLRFAVTVHAAWIGGSFTTSKLDPADLDVTFIIDGTEQRSRGPQQQKIISLFQGRGQVKSVLKLRIDSYILPWEYVPSVPPAGLFPVQDVYYRARGYWDDWWQRTRAAPASGQSAQADALPRRGYLEVPVSDYT
jgi:hypothetical protein